MRNEARRNGIIIGALLITIALMTVGYAALATQLSIEGTSNISDASWNIEFESITKNSDLSTAGAIEKAVASASGTSASFNVELSKPGDKMVYDLVVQNKGSIDATLKEISGPDNINLEEPTDITYTVQRLDDEGSVTTSEGDLLSGSSHKFRVTIEWKAEATSIPGTKTKTGTINFNYEQK